VESQNFHFDRAGVTVPDCIVGRGLGGDCDFSREATLASVGI